MCRLLVVLNKIKDPSVAQAVQLHMHDLENAMGGDGNGLWMPEANDDRKLVRSENIEELWDNMQAPFMFHTRRATGNNVTVENMHPYDYKGVVLMHNGFASQFTVPATKSDTLNLLEKWRDEHEKDDKKTILDYSWHGNIIIYDKDQKDLKFYVKNTLEELTLIDDTKIVTSQITPALHGFIKEKKTIRDAVFKSQFDNPLVEKVGEIPYAYTTTTTYTYYPARTYTTTPSTTAYSSNAASYTRATPAPITTPYKNVMYDPKWDEEYNFDGTPAVKTPVVQPALQTVTDARKQNEDTAAAERRKRHEDRRWGIFNR